MTARAGSFFSTMMVLILITSGCGWGTNNATGKHTKTVRKSWEQNLISGNLNFTTSASSIAMGYVAACGNLSSMVGSDGSFAIPGVEKDCSNSPVYATLYMNNGTVVSLRSFWTGTPLDGAYVIRTIKENWQGTTEDTFEVSSTNPVYITDLTEMAFRLSTSDYQSGKDSANYYLNRYFGTSDAPVDYIATPTPASQTILAANSEVLVAPYMATVAVGGQITFTANRNVVWSVVEQNSGSINASGVFTAPATIGTVTLQATSSEEPDKSAVAKVSVVAKNNMTLPLILNSTTPPVTITVKEIAADGLHLNGLIQCPDLQDRAFQVSGSSPFNFIIPPDPTSANASRFRVQTDFGTKVLQGSLVPVAGNDSQFTGTLILTSGGVATEYPGVLFNRL